MEFKDKAVAAKYESTLGVDKTITLPQLYHGQLSGITIEAADALFASGDNQLKPKPATKEKAEKPQP